MPNIGARFEVSQPGYGETTRLPVALFDDDGAPVTGVTWDAPGMVVTCCPEGGTLADFPTFASENWREVGGGLYEVLIRGDDATERALLATPGLFYLRVVCTATSLNTALHAYKVSSADVTREDTWTDVRAALLDQLDAATNDTLANILADITEEADGTYRITAGALALLNDLSAQNVRDALKLAPTAGDPAEDSVDAVLSTVLNRLGAFTGTGINTILGFLRAIMRSDADTPSDVGGTFDPATDALEALRDRGDSGAWGGAAGSGANEVVVTASDGAGLLANGVKVTVQDANGNTVGSLITNSLGQATFYLDDGTGADAYTFVTATTSFWQGSSTEVEVSGDTAVALTLIAQTLPAPPAPGKYTVVVNATDEHDATVGAGERTYRIVAIYPPNDPTNNLLRATERNALVTDANGQASFEIGQTVTGFALEERYTDAAGKPVVRVRQFTVRAGAADANGYIYAADIEDTP